MIAEMGRDRAIRHGYADVNGLKLHYAESGNPGRPLLIFLHGFPEFWRCWRAQLEALCDDYHCVAPDLPGYNLSSRPADVERYKARLLVDDVIAFASQFSQGRTFTLIAHDWGGALAWALAIRRPDLLDRLIIINAVHPAAFRRELVCNHAQRQASNYIHALRSHEAEALISADNFDLLWRSFIETESKGFLTEVDRQAYQAAWSQPGALTGMLNWYRAMHFEEENALTHDRSADGALMVNVPTLVVWGMQDKAFLPGCLDNLDRWVPDIEIHRVPDATHWIVHEEPQFIANLITEWLERRAQTSW